VSRLCCPTRYAGSRALPLAPWDVSQGVWCHSRPAVTLWQRKPLCSDPNFLLISLPLSHESAIMLFICYSVLGVHGMTRARIVNICFHVMAAFWAVIVITKAQTPTRWHAYAIAALGVVVISVIGTRLKHRIHSRTKGSTSRAAMTAASRP
jgi:hypothetical protein